MANCFKRSHVTFFFILFSLHFFVFSCQKPYLTDAGECDYSLSELIYLALVIGRTDTVNNANVNSQNSLGITPLMLAALRNNMKIGALLLSRFGADPSIKNCNNDTPLLILIHCRHTRHRLDFMQLLLEYNADPNVQDCDGNTPLMIAGSKGRLRMAKLLLAHGADPTIKNREGKTFLDLAGNRLAMLDLLKCEKIY